MVKLRRDVDEDMTCCWKVLILLSLRYERIHKITNTLHQVFSRPTCSQTLHVQHPDGEGKTIQRLHLPTAIG